MPAWAWLAAIVASRRPCDSASRATWSAPWIMVDELVYSELAKCFAATGSFPVRDVPTAGYGFVYPVLIARRTRFFRSIPHAYSAIKAINALLMSLAAVPRTCSRAASSPGAARSSSPRSPSRCRRCSTPAR